jgi:heterodisulfide reductase subunit A
MMRVGIPPYRLPHDVPQREIDAILNQPGVEIHLNHPVQNINELFNQGYKAVVLAIGAHAAQKIGIPGEDAEGVFQGAPFLRAVNLDEEVKVSGRVLVIGGGNTAVDTARTAQRLGADEVWMIYRRSRVEMPAIEEEIEQAEEEGIRLELLTQPVEVISENGHISALKCVRMKLGEPDASGRRRPIPIEGSEFVIDCDMLIAAVAQVPEISLLDPDHDLEIDPRRQTFIVDENTLITNRPDVFAVGDAVTGPASLIEAIAQGRRAALSVDRYLRGEPLLTPSEQVEPQSTAELSEAEIKDILAQGKASPTPRAELPTRPPEERRRDFREVALALTEEQARAEAARCLQCGLCSECYLCVAACEANCIDHTMTDEYLDLDVGAVILATGYDLYDPIVMPQYGYGLHPDVITALQFERMTSAGGPTSGKVLTHDGRQPEAIALLHCIGSRDENHLPHCSRVCCMYAIKQAHMARDKTGAEVYQFYIDIRAAGKGYEDFYHRIQDEGVHMIRGKVGEVEPKNGKLIVRAEDTMLGRVVEVPVDMVVLMNGWQPAEGTKQVAQMFRVSLSPDGFFAEAHPKLRPVETNTAGIFLAGACQTPKDIPDTVAQASGAAVQAVKMLAKGVVDIDPTVAHVITERCTGCGECVLVCPYQAISLVEGKAEVNEALCTGCGTCAAACVSKAIVAEHFTDQQLVDQVIGIMAQEEPVYV